MRQTVMYYSYVLWIDRSKTLKNVKIDGTYLSNQIARCLFCTVDYTAYNRKYDTYKEEQITHICTVRSTSKSNNF